MQTMTFHYRASGALASGVHVGQVASGDLEVLITPEAGSGTATVRVRTSADGFDVVWRRVLDRYFEAGALEARYELNDAGATPGMVALRLAQALELAGREEAHR